MEGVEAGQEGEDVRAEYTRGERELVQTAVPRWPDKAVLERLVSTAPLSYMASAAGPATDKVPQRKFCEMCGYWGKMKCLVCGSYVCSLACKGTHDQTEHPHR